MVNICTVCLIVTLLDPVVIMHTTNLKSQPLYTAHVCVLRQFQNTHDSNISHKSQPISLQNAPWLRSVDPYTIYINACLPVCQPSVHTSNPVVLTRQFVLSPNTPTSFQVFLPCPVLPFLHHPVLQRPLAYYFTLQTAHFWHAKPYHRVQEAFNM